MKIDVLFVCVLCSRRLSYEPVCPFLCLSLYFHTFVPLSSSYPRRFSFARTSWLSLSFFHRPTHLCTLSFTIVSILISTCFTFILCRWFARTFHPFYTFIRTSRLCGHFPALLFVSSFVLPCFSFVRYFPLWFLPFFSLWWCLESSGIFYTTHVSVHCYVTLFVIKIQNNYEKL